MNERIMHIQYELRGIEIVTIVFVYGPNESARDMVKDEIWTCLKTLLEIKHEILVIGGYCDCRAGNNGITTEKYIGRFTLRLYFKLKA